MVEVTQASQKENDAVWARFYRDGKPLGEIANEFGGSIYSYSPWLYASITQQIIEATATITAERDAALEQVRVLREAARHALTFIENRFSDLSPEKRATAKHLRAALAFTGQQGEG